jgi:imidazole glycerol-phosphate synthase subunit HisH
MIGILDYGMGNLGSVSNACRFLELPARVIAAPEAAAGCDALLLPGVGAFGDCLAHLRARGFEDVCRRWIAADRPFLGVCVGLQALFDGSEESPDEPGLGILAGRVRRLERGPGLKVPQMGWNRVRFRRPECPLFEGVADDAFFYFVHSYYVDPADASAVAGTTWHGVEYASAVWRGRCFAVQFHPEKSQDVGLRVLRNFGRLATG